MSGYVPEYGDELWVLPNADSFDPCGVEGELPAEPRFLRADPNASGIADISDATYLLNHLFPAAIRP